MRKTGQIIDEVNRLYHDGIMSKKSAIDRLSRLADKMNQHQVKRFGVVKKLYTAERLLK